MQTVTLPLSDLVAIRAAINSSYYHNLALDMGEAYRKLNRQNRGSAMTLALKDALTMSNDAIEMATGKQPTPEEAGDVVRAS